MNQLNLAVAQMVSSESPSQNLQQILKLWSSLDKSVKVHGLCLPENSLYNKVKKSSLGFSFNSPEIVQLQKLAQSENVFINLGAIPFKEKNGVSNATVLINSDGQVSVVYKKIHLFDLDMGPIQIRESESFIPGDRPSTLIINNWKTSFAICYDVRFAELFLNYASKESEIIFVPAAFTRLTGKAHWHTLLRARAIENQCYVIAPAQTGVAKVGEETRASYGHSLVVDPWGKVILELKNDKPEIGIVTVSKAAVNKVRAQMPIKSHRKL